MDNVFKKESKKCRHWTFLEIIKRKTKTYNYLQNLTYRNISQIINKIYTQPRWVELLSHSYQTQL